MYFTELLKKLDTGVTFRPDSGAFRSQLAEMFINNGDRECAELFSEHSCDILISASEHTVAEDKISFMVISDLGEQTMECALSALPCSSYIFSDDFLCGMQLRPKSEGSSVQVS